MKKGLMTAEELVDRYIPEEALALSIEKWERAGDLKNWDELALDADEHLGCDVCGLCLKHNVTSCNDNGPCPLVDRDGRGCLDGSDWLRAFRAADDGDRKDFMKQRRVILKRMRKAYERGER